MLLLASALVSVGMKQFDDAVSITVVSWFYNLGQTECEVFIFISVCHLMSDIAAHSIPLKLGATLVSFCLSL
jgi:hypothetical protein